MPGMPWEEAAPGELSRACRSHVDCRLHRYASFARTEKGAEHKAGWTRRADRRTHHARNRRTPAVPECGRFGLHLSRPLRGDALRRRRPANSIGHTDWLEAARRALRAG